jgi:hypothetical protein
MLLLQLACDKLRREYSVRPGLTRLERLIATACQQAHDETWRRLTPLVTADQHPWLDSLLQPDAQTGRTVLTWLRREATAHTATQIVETLQKIAFLLAARIDTWDIVGLNPNRVKTPNWGGSPTPPLQRMDPRRRCQSVACNKRSPSYRVATNSATSVYGSTIVQSRKHSKSSEPLPARPMAQFRALGQVLLDSAIDDAAVRVVGSPGPGGGPPGRRRTAGLLRPRHDDAIDALDPHSTIRQFAPGVLQTLTFPPRDLRTPCCAQSSDLDARSCPDSASRA